MLGTVLAQLRLAELLTEMMVDRMLEVVTVVVLDTMLAQLLLATEVEVEAETRE